LDDTSVAVVSLANGDRRMFFQEASGSIRESLFTSSTGQWTSDVANIVASDAMNFTPIAALPMNASSTTLKYSGVLVCSCRALGRHVMLIHLQIYLFYYSKENRLASRQFISGTWVSQDDFSPAVSGSKSYPVAQNSRILSASLLPNTSTTGEALLYYPDPSGTVTVLNIFSNDSGGISSNITTSLSSKLQGGHVLSVASGVSSTSGTLRPQVGVLVSYGTVYYDLYFSFYGNGSWTPPARKSKDAWWARSGC
jgi:hypothetical protein